MKLGVTVYNYLAPLTRLIAPAQCRFCGSASVSDEEDLCAACRAGLPWNAPACPGCALPSALPVLCAECQRRPRAFDTAWTAFVHAAPVRSAVVSLKYRARFDQSRLLGRLMADALARRPDPLPQLLLPVPLHRWRLMRRGYNQALELARAISKRLDIEVDASAAKRTRATPSQVKQTAAQRRRNLRGVFRMDRDLDGIHVALLDDVMTTGATLEELARAARAAGAARIEAWAVTREP